MFIVTDEPTFTHDVTARVPVDGGFAEETFKATFRVIDPEEVDSFVLATTEGAAAFLKRVIVRLDGIADAEKRPVEWSDQVRDAVLRLPWARSALARTYFTAISGAKTGN
ncbi:MAG: hypothetical protein J0I69_02735 [Altererythrobacter sp.]|nr:hypothetical protein [Altererythrobacter sp.]OJU60936.1 MAG: hypothetical protein BGO08_12485 [Altererythrobacter sp. 66-12]